MTINNPISQSQPKHNQDEGTLIIHQNDVLSGRGNFVNYHEGNKHFRQIVNKYKLQYVSCAKNDKPLYANLVVNEIYDLSPPGRFLCQVKSTKRWYDIGRKKALDKAKQALREGAPKLAKLLQAYERNNPEELGGCFSTNSGRKYNLIVPSCAIAVPNIKTIIVDGIQEGKITDLKRFLVHKGETQEAPEKRKVVEHSENESLDLDYWSESDLSLFQDISDESIDNSYS